MQEEIKAEMVASEDAQILFDDVPTNRFHIKLTALTFGAHFTEGYSLATISIVLTMLAGELQNDPVWQGLLGSSALMGIFLGSLVFGRLSDRIGRQKIFMLSFIVVAVASLCQFFVTSNVTLFWLRIIIGFGIGGDYAVSVTLLAEFVPRKTRGMLTGCLCAVWTVGYVTANVIGFYVAGVGGDAWRWLLASAAIPAALVLVGRIGTPESPRWLIRQGRRGEAEAIVERYIGKNVRIEEEPELPKSGYRALFTKRYRKMTLFVSLYWALNVIPYFAVYTFLPTLLGLFGLAEDFTIDLVLNGTLLAGSIIGTFLTSRITRRQFAIGGFAISAVGLFTIMLVPLEYRMIIIIAFAIFTMAISGGSVLDTVFPSECLPTEVRASANGLSTAVSRIASALGTFLIPLSLAAFGAQGTMGILGAVCVVGTVMCIAWTPATEHMTLSEASAGIDTSTKGASKPSVTA